MGYNWHASAREILISSGFFCEPTFKCTLKRLLWRIKNRMNDDESLADLRLFVLALIGLRFHPKTPAEVCAALASLDKMLIIPSREMYRKRKKLKKVCRVVDKHFCASGW